MMASLFEMVVYIIVNLLAVKMVFFRKGRGETTEQSVTWKAAVDSMEIMENRLLHLQERDLKAQERELKHQERIWALEDQNRDLNQRLARVTKELLIVGKSSEDQGPQFDDDDDDHLSSVPPNS